MKPVQAKLQVRHYAQIPCAPFCVEVNDEFEAKKIVDTLANQHLFLYEKNIIPDYSNAIMVVMWNDEEKDWLDYYNEAEDMDWDQLEEAYFSGDLTLAKKDVAIQEIDSILKQLVFIFDNEANYPEGTVGYNLAQRAKKVLYGNLHSVYDHLCIEKALLKELQEDVKLLEWLTTEVNSGRITLWSDKVQLINQRLASAKEWIEQIDKYNKEYVPISSIIKKDQ